MEGSNQIPPPATPPEVVAPQPVISDTQSSYDPEGLFPFRVLFLSFFFFPPVTAISLDESTAFLCYISENKRGAREARVCYRHRARFES
jgi:hypothetical protein